MVTLIDVRRVLNGEAPTCEGLWKNRLSRSERLSEFNAPALLSCWVGSGRPLTPISALAVTSETARDLKLMSSVLGVEHYSLLALGALTVSLSLCRLRR